MKILTAIGLPMVAAAILFSLAPASAQTARTYRWCLMHGGPRDMAGMVLCRFETLAQCMASRNSFADTCYINPEYTARRN
ncbi:MAG TPA: DUF3551 domain-containing protein [Xanthobacteraceae bacterium]|nr:DUF3551 domain-containing protein [Xanthobacteraceae bacterium]